MNDTIFALSSAPGRAGVAVIRVSGPRARTVAEALIGGALPPPRLAAVRFFRDGAGRPIDQGLLIWFEGPASFTGEDMAEFHLHGGRRIVEVTLGELGSVLRCRPAEAGEFTRRAVENGKLDLTRAEAIADLIDAETEAQRRQALRQYRGVLTDLYDEWRERLIAVLAWVEAEIDFSDEELPDGNLARARREVFEIIVHIENHLNDSHRGEIVRDGIFLTVIGAPNSGKSSLINALSKRDVAIVAETPGTTRDIIEVRMNIAGWLVIAADTAGLRQSSDPVEREGMRRALAQADHSNIVLLLLDGSSPDPFAGLPDGIRADLVVWNKADLPWPAPREGSAICAKSGSLAELLVALQEKIAAKLDTEREAPVLTRARYRRALEEALAALRRGADMPDAELFAEDLRLAVRAIGRITGRVDVEELLDVVFRDFCIGK